MSNDLIRALEGAFEKKQVLTKASELLCYAYDATAGDAGRVPDVVVLPASTDEVARVVRSGDTRRTKRPESGCEQGRAVLEARGVVLLEGACSPEKTTHSYSDSLTIT